MSAPEIPSGWEDLFSDEDEFLAGQVVTLARLQRSKAADISPALLGSVHDMLQGALEDTLTLPELEQCQALPYLGYSVLRRRLTGGGIQLNFVNGNQFVAVRRQVYYAVEGGAVPADPFEAEHVEHLTDVTTKLGIACAYRRLWVANDLTTIQGDPNAPKIVRTIC